MVEHLQTELGLVQATCTYFRSEEIFCVELLGDSKAKQIIERRADRQKFAAEAIAPSRSDVFVSRKEKQNATSSFVEYLGFS